MAIFSNQLIKFLKIKQLACKQVLLWSQRGSVKLPGSASCPPWTTGKGGGMKRVGEESRVDRPNSSVFSKQGGRRWITGGRVPEDCGHLDDPCGPRAGRRAEPQWRTSPNWKSSLPVGPGEASEKNTVSAYKQTALDPRVAEVSGRSAGPGSRRLWDSCCCEDCSGICSGLESE